MTKKITDYSVEGIGKYINDLEMENAKHKLDEQVKQAKLANKQQMINSVVSFITERANMEVMAMLGFIKLDK